MANTSVKYYVYHSLAQKEFSNHRNIFASLQDFEDFIRNPKNWIRYNRYCGKHHLIVSYKRSNDGLVLQRSNGGNVYAVWQIFTEQYNEWELLVLTQFITDLPKKIGRSYDPIFGAIRAQGCIRISRTMTENIIPNAIKEYISNVYAYIDKMVALQIDNIIIRNLWILNFNIHCKSGGFLLYCIAERVPYPEYNKGFIWQLRDQLYTAKDICQLIQIAPNKVSLPMTVINTKEFKLQMRNVKLMEQTFNDPNERMKILNIKNAWQKVKSFTNNKDRTKRDMKLTVRKPQFLVELSDAMNKKDRIKLIEMLLFNDKNEAGYSIDALSRQNSNGNDFGIAYKVKTNAYATIMASGYHISGGLIKTHCELTGRSVGYYLVGWISNISNFAVGDPMKLENEVVSLKKELEKYKQKSNLQSDEERKLLNEDNCQISVEEAKVTTSVMSCTGQNNTNKKWYSNVTNNSNNNNNNNTNNNGRIHTNQQYKAQVINDNKPWPQTAYNTCQMRPPDNTQVVTQQYNINNNNNNNNSSSMFGNNIGMSMTNHELGIYNYNYSVAGAPTYPSIAIYPTNPLQLLYNYIPITQQNSIMAPNNALNNINMNNMNNINNVNNMNTMNNMNNMNMNNGYNVPQNILPHTHNTMSNIGGRSANQLPLVYAAINNQLITNTTTSQTPTKLATVVEEE